MSIADYFYPSSAKQPGRAPRARAADGWRELPGGGWVKYGSYGSGGIVIRDGYEAESVPERRADVFYGERE